MGIFWNCMLCNAAMINNNINNNKSLSRKPTVRATLNQSYYQCIRINNNKKSNLSNWNLEAKATVRFLS